MHGGLKVDKLAISNRLDADKESFEKIAKVLSNRFDIIPPSQIILKVDSLFRRTGRYWYVSKKMKIGHRKASCFVHEFAHHLANIKHGSSGWGHGKLFKRCLWRVAKAYYGDVTEYPWEKEYRSVWKYYERRISMVGANSPRDKVKRSVHDLYVKYYEKGKAKREKIGITVTQRRNGLKKVYLYPLYLTLRNQKKTDEDILVEFKKVAETRSEKYLRDKIKYFHGKKMK